MKKTILIPLFFIGAFNSKSQEFNMLQPPGTYLMSNVNVALSCPASGTFYDSGGNAGQYAISENYTKTFSVPAGNCIQFNFSAFSTESCCDRLYIFDGPTGGSPLIGIYNGVTSPGIVSSSGTSLTFSFTSDGSINDIGWVADIICLPPCSGVPIGGAALANPSSGCAAFNTTLSVGGGSSGCGLTYQWQSAPALAGPYANIGGATTANYSLNVAVTTYFRRIIFCGASSGTSAAVSCSVGMPSIPCSLGTYAAASVAYSWDNFVGTTTPTGDDDLYNGFGLFGFPFCYVGQSYSGGYIAANSSFVFDGIACFPNLYPMPGGIYAAPGQFTGWSISAAAPTNADYTPRNAILGPWQDLYPPFAGTIRYATLGVSPNRRFVASWENVAMYSCTGTLFSGQIKLFETSNNIEIHIQSKNLCPTWNSGQAIMGLHNYNGSVYIPPVNAVAHNAPTNWTMSNTAYRFTSTCPSNSICGVVLPVNFKSFSGQNMDGLNKLWWETSEEANTREFIVERSLDGANFKQIAQDGSLGKPTKHAYVDNTFERGYINYYKITAIDLNGNKSSTGIYSVFNTDDKILINSVFPNPASDKLSAKIFGRGRDLNCSFVIYDQFGRAVISKNEVVSMGNNQVDIDLESLEKGVYIIEIKADENTVISKQKFSKN